MAKNQINYIDLFAGAGGLSEGFLASGYHPVAHVEMNKDACNTLKTRACYYYLKENDNLQSYYNYLKGILSREELYDIVPDSIINAVINHTMSNETMPDLFNRIDDCMIQQNVKQIDLIVGGPPCQAYSLAGRARKGEEIKKDPRNLLYKLYIEVLKKYTPEMFVFENVPGMLNANNGKYFNDLKNELQSIEYEVSYMILNAADFGVLQDRKRVILIGWKKGTDHYYPFFQKTRLPYSVSDLFDDLPAIQPGERNNNYKPGHYSKYLTESSIRESQDILTWHEARPNIEKDRQIYRKVIEEWKSKHRRLQYTDLPPDLGTHNNKTAFLDRFKVVADDLPTSHTMVAHINKDGHYFIHPDLKQARSISVREAARIQSFPDSYFFEGPRTAVLMQIGNAVPPLMAKGIASELKKQLEQNDEQYQY